jgi:hypothetical protein
LEIMVPFQETTTEAFDLLCPVSEVSSTVCEVCRPRQTKERCSMTHNFRNSWTCFSVNTIRNLKRWTYMNKVKLV